MLRGSTPLPLAAYSYAGSIHATAHLRVWRSCSAKSMDTAVHALHYVAVLYSYSY